MRIDKATEVARGVAGTVIAATGIVTPIRINTGGSVVLSAGGSCDGIIIPHATRQAYGTAIAVGDRLDILTRGEVVEFEGTAGDRIYATATGALVTTGGTLTTYIGYVAEGGERLVVRM